MTKQHVIAQFLRTFPDMSDQAEEYFDRAYRRLLGEAPVAREWKEAALVAGQSELLLTEEIIEAAQVVLAESFSPGVGYRGRKLKPVFDEMGPGFSLSPREGRLALRLHPAPTSSSGPGGFPKAAIFGSFWIQPSLSFVLPTTLLDPSLLTSRMKEYASEDLDPASASYFRSEADRKTSELRAWLSERVEGERGAILPLWLEGLRRSP